jgi:P4 family phage/plasmid primase-like protien
MIGARKMADDLKLYDLKEIRKAINVLFSDVKFGDGECIEVRIFDKKKKLVVSGWFDDLDLLARRVALAARDGVGSPGSYRFIQDNVYWTVNPVDDVLLSRQPKNTLDFVSENSKDSNITRRCWFPIDVDPLRPSGVSATKEERKLAVDVINAMAGKLEELGFTDSMYVGGSSGNGFHCLIRVDLPNDDDSRDLLRDCLKSLNMFVGTAKVEIDPKVFNAGRIIKAYGTMARKGVNDEKRPWHMSKLSHIPERVEIAPRELLEKLAALVPKGGNPKRAVEDKPQGPWTEENLQKYIDEGTDWNCLKQEGKKTNEVCRWIGRCTNNDEHTDAAIILHTDGWWSYGCFHASCDHFRHERFKAFWTEHKGKYKFPTLNRESGMPDGFPVEFLSDATGETPRAQDEEIPLYNLTDAGNAERLTWRYKNQFLYCPQRDWFAWDGKRWKPDGVSAITLASIATVRKIKDELNRALEGLDPEKEEDRDKIADISKVYNSWAKTSEGHARLEAMASIGEKFLPVEMHRFDQDRMLFNCANGTIDLKTGELCPHRREDYITTISPVVYDPIAECSLWMDFLSDVTAGNDELIRYLQRAVGYSLTGLTVEHCMFMLWGTGRNGKSTFLEVIQHLMGEYSKAAHMNTFMQKKQDEGIPNDLAALAAARFVSATESDDGKRLAEAKIKQITGGDTVTARFLHREFFQFQPQFKIWLGTNHKPTIYGTDEGIWRRIRLIPFEVYIPDSKKDEKLTQKLISEAPGILNWALQGLEEYRLHGMMEPEIVKASTDDYRASQDWMTRFLGEVTESSQESNIPARKLYEKYVDWCNRTGEFKLKEAKFAEGMQQKGMRSKEKRQEDGRKRMAYEGMKLRDGMSGFSMGEAPLSGLEELSGY